MDTNNPARVRSFQSGFQVTFALLTKESAPLLAEIQALPELAGWRFSKLCDYGGGLPSLYAEPTAYPPVKGAGTAAKRQVKALLRERGCVVVAENAPLPGQCR